MKVAYRFRLDCDKARDILAAIPAPSIHEPVEITSNSAKPQKKKRKLETSKNLVEDLFTFKNSGDSKDKSFVKIKKETNYVEVVLANPGTEKRLHHTCYMCKIEFPTTTLKAMHNEEVHKKDGLMICTYTSCNYTALSWKELCKHAFNHRPSIVSIFQEFSVMNLF